MLCIQRSSRWSVESSCMSVGYYWTISLRTHCKFYWVGNKRISHLLNLSLYNVLWPCTILLSHHHGCKNRSKSVLANGSSLVCDPLLHGEVCCIIIILGKRIKWCSPCFISPSQKNAKIKGYSLLPCFLSHLSLSLLEHNPNYQQLKTKVELKISSPEDDMGCQPLHT